ncbi:N-acetyl-gamma-glutamyl-phosphate reductase [Anaerosphaera aminiphila DSM 21120]|uniref:N-acetyl-gamma-glutamyl-phosphate reductase n=1 Tax=Anaerosphaera aminiphila DSM 21120 TaxID=1120995 RepID=A0A1M5PR46_9FIRM|nr:N-acetyl-gamma-glutamyl-phosphate reductase [Anaerosphaera aminiphila]SHH04056.1 N-acetyl-gamma-glutamyl-phosphate reductase [Anaerosphaera aminiphila DSM 21120]
MEGDEMLKVGIVGSTGYAGEELVRMLLNHKEVEIKWLYSQSYVGEKYSKVFGNFFKIVDSTCVGGDVDELSKEVDLIFTATPQGYCSGIVNEKLLDRVKIVDLSADFRIKNIDVYKEWYKLDHKSPEFIAEAVYGLCEINRDKIKDARIVANPGCYTTASILALYPLVKEKIIDVNSIIIDAKSGTTGAGRGTSLANLYCEVNENIKAYGITNHRHTPEIEEQLSYGANENIIINFTPHLIPMNRGILATSYVNLNGEKTYQDIKSIYEKYYGDEYFIRLLDEGVYPETKWIQGSNYVDINFKVDERTNRLVVISAIDNLVKGAAGQAIQNMNIMFGFKESEAIFQVPMFP